LTRPTISYHLKILVEAGIFIRDKRGVWAYYALVPSALDALSAVLSTHPEARTGPDRPPPGAGIRVMILSGESSRRPIMRVAAAAGHEPPRTLLKTARTRPIVTGRLVGPKLRI
jgi:hypothetical protein